MGLYARLQFMPAHFILTFKEAFLTSFFEGQSQILGLLNPTHHVKWVSYTNQELHIELPTLLHTLNQINRQRELELALQHYKGAPSNLYVGVQSLGEGEMFGNDRD